MCAVHIEMDGISIAMQVIVRVSFHALIVHFKVVKSSARWTDGSTKP